MIFKNRYIPAFLNLGVQIFSTFCVILGVILYGSSIVTFPNFLLIAFFSIIAVYLSRHDFKLKMKQLEEGVFLPLKTDKSSPSILYLLKEGFITAQVSEKKWDVHHDRFSYKVDIRLNSLCPPLRVGKAEDGHATISYLDGSGELKITNEVLEKLKSDS